MLALAIAALCHVATGPFRVAAFAPTASGSRELEARVAEFRDQMGERSAEESELRVAESFADERMRGWVPDAFFLDDAHAMAPKHLTHLLEMVRAIRHVGFVSASQVGRQGHDLARSVRTFLGQGGELWRRVASLESKGSLGDDDDDDEGAWADRNGLSAWIYDLLHSPRGTRVPCLQRVETCCVVEGDGSVSLCSVARERGQGPRSFVVVGGDCRSAADLWSSLGAYAARLGVAERHRVRLVRAARGGGRVRYRQVAKLCRRVWPETETSRDVVARGSAARETARLAMVRVLRQRRLGCSEDLASSELARRVALGTLAQHTRRQNENEMGPVGVALALALCLEQY
jgi:hypothetical protein